MEQAMKCGGTSDIQPADEDIRKLCDELRSSIEEKLGNKTTVFVAVSYKTQVVAGTNYFVKIEVDGGNYIHVRIFQPLPCHNAAPEVNSIQKGKTLEDDIEYF